MCGRYNLRTTAADLSRMFQATVGGELPFRYNIAPTQLSVVCRRSETGQNEIVPLRWGLIPSWAKEKKIGASLINARAETIAEKPSFRRAFEKRRCLVPTSGFYEWRREGKLKLPFHIHHSDDSVFAMAGVWESWNRAGERIESFSIITTPANSLMTPLHDRMPVVLEPELFTSWLDPNSEPEFLKSLLEPHEWAGFEIVPVSPIVNNARNETPECLAAMT